MTSRSAARPVFVIGAGMAGLAAGWRIQEAGHSVVVLESADRVGGRVHSVAQDGHVMEAGATMASGSYTHFLKFAEDAGLASDLVPGGTILGFAREGAIHNINSRRLLIDGIRTRLLSWRSKVTLVKLAIDLARAAPHIIAEDGGASAPLDTETAGEYCRRRLNREIFDYVVDGVIRGMEGVDGEHISKAEFFLLLKGVIGGQIFVPRGGMARFTDAIAGKLDVRTNARAVRVTEVADGVEVTWTGLDGTERTDSGLGAVIATPGYRVPEIYPQLDSESAAFLRSLEYSSMISVNIGLSRRPSEPASMVVVPRTVPGGLFAITLEHNKAPDRVPADKGLVGAYVTSAQSIEWLNATDEAVADGVLSVLEPLMGGVRQMVEFVRVNRWYPAAIIPRKGHYKRLAAFNARRSRLGRVHFAGDYFSASCLNTAVASGERAARDLSQAIELSTRARQIEVAP